MRLVITILICFHITAVAGNYKPHLGEALELDKKVCAMAQRAISGLADDDLKLITISSKEKKRLVGSFAFSKPSIDVKDGNVQLEVQYNRKKSNDSVREIACKMKSQEAIVEATGFVPVKEEPTCAELNQMVLDIALSLVDKNEAKHYIFLEDDVKGTGLSWLNSNLEYNLVDDLVEVRSPALKSGLNTNPRYAGMRYCKLLSVSRAYKHITFTIF